MACSYIQNIYLVNFSSMSLLEQIHEAESSESLKAFRERVGRMTPRERQEFIQYCKMTGERELAEDFFALDSLDIIS